MDAVIRHLFESPQQIPTVAQWIYNEFWANQDRHTPESLQAALREATCPDRIPLSLVATCYGLPVGTVNLIENDDEDRPHLTPWLAALFVQPGFRGRGIGSLLVRSLKHNARQMDVPVMHLGTDNPRFYARLGATILERRRKDLWIMVLASSED
jgi:predicted N-acetyltransferase YhbS